MKRIVLALGISAMLFSALPAAAETIEAFGFKWNVPISADWSVEKTGGLQVLQLNVARPQQTPRRWTASSNGAACAAIIPTY